MAHRLTYTQGDNFQNFPNRSEHGNIRNILTKLQRRFSDNNKSQRQPRSIQRNSKTAPNTPLQEPKSPRMAGNYAPMKEIDKAISVLRSDEFRCLYNAKKGLTESVQANRPLPPRFDFEYSGNLVVLDRPSLYPHLDKEMSNSPLSDSRNSSHHKNDKNGHRNYGSNLSGESVEIPVRCQVSLYFY